MKRRSVWVVEGRHPRNKNNNWQPFGSSFDCRQSHANDSKREFEGNLRHTKWKFRVVRYDASKGG